MDGCIFCKIIVREVPVTPVMETDDLIVIKDIAPKAPIHYLILPKIHVSDIQSLAAEQLFYGTKIFSVAQQLAKTVSGAEHFKLVTNNGRSAGQHVFHLHVHFLAGTLKSDV